MTKKLIKTLLLTVAVVMLCLTAGITANAEIWGDYEYTLLDDGTVEITGYIGSDTELDIPSEIDGKPVTSIGEYAFYNCNGLTGELIIPESVTSIGAFAFAGCNGLSGELLIPEGVISIGEYAFSNCSSLTGDLNIPKGVTNIGDFTFYECNGLTGDLIIPEGVTSIGQRAFYNCSGFKGKLIIPESVTSIDYAAFCNCSGLTGDLIIPKSVTIISVHAFSGCSGLTGNLIIPEGITSIEYYAFSDCSGLTGNLIIPKSVINVDDYSFANCSGFTGNLIISEGVMSIGGRAFAGCSGLTGDLIIPESVTSIDHSAFNGCSGLSGNLIIPESVMIIGNSVFDGCTLKHVAYKGTEEQWSNISFGSGNSSLTNAPYLHLNFNQETDITEIIVPSTCKTEGMEGTVCSCGYIYSKTYFDKLEHTYKTVVTAPTCTEQGYTTYSCDCGDSYTEVISKLKDHTFTEWITVDNVSCRNCTVCGFKETKIITNGGDIQIEAPEQPDCDFEVDEPEKDSNTYVLAQQVVADNTGDNTEVLKVFDITLKNSDGVHVQPDGSVKVKLPLDWEKDGNYKVYRVNDDGTLTDMNAYRQGSHMVFDTNHFSIYVIVEEKTDNTPSEPENPSDNCSHLCHKSGFIGFIWKIINFLQRIFGISPVCECGAAHY